MTPKDNLKQRWRRMMSRCYDPKDKDYPSYGGRGIYVAERWHNFDAFYQDMGDPPPGKWLDRIDNDRSYEPGNLRWASPHEQQQNTRRTVKLCHDNKSLTLYDWAKVTGIHPKTIYGRIFRLNWKVADALTRPIRRKAS